MKVRLGSRRFLMGGTNRTHGGLPLTGNARMASRTSPGYGFATEKEPQVATGTHLADFPGKDT
jgi:hypothetical protein